MTTTDDDFLELIQSLIDTAESDEESVVGATDRVLVLALLVIVNKL
jgi:hypothetical protein